MSVYQPGDNCLTFKAALETLKGAANVDFVRQPDGRLAVQRIDGVSNHLADQDFDSLTPAEQDLYGRWVVGYQFGPVSQPIYYDLDFETTLLNAGDRVHLYYLTASDLRPQPDVADTTESLTLATDGSAPQYVDLNSDFSVGDVIELELNSDFHLHEAYTESRGDVYVMGCGQVLNSTFHGVRSIADSDQNAIVIPSFDFYGFQIRLNEGTWMGIEDLLAHPDANAELLSDSGYPDYSVTVRFTITEELTGGFPVVPVDVQNALSLQTTYTVGFTGWNSAGRPVSCTHQETPGTYMSNHVTISTWFGEDGVDQDGDTSFSAASGGIDFNDFNNRQFPFCPEHLDGIDNNGDGAVDNAPLICPSGVLAGSTAGCVLSNGMGWYPPSANLSVQWREISESGTPGSWQAIPFTYSGGLTFTMPTDDNVASIELQTTYWDSGTSFVGSNIVDQIEPPPDCPDNDGDGWTTCDGDCKDIAPNINPGMPEICRNRMDDNCNGMIDEGCDDVHPHQDP